MRFKRSGRLSLIALTLVVLVTAHTWSSPAQASVPLSAFETDLPESPGWVLSLEERRLLIAYLDSPNRAERAAALGELHAERFRSRLASHARGGEILESAILTQYFYHRAELLGLGGAHVRRALESTQVFLERLQKQRGPISTDEGRVAHLWFRLAFHFKEHLRRPASQGLLDEFAKDPRNVYTSFANTAIRLWMGGESKYDDPSVVYDFALGSFFSLHTIDLAHELEKAWIAKPNSVTRFRMATILGGFSALQRRWLAVLHKDTRAVGAIDDEHRKWRLIQRAFHSFTIGIPFFEVPALFDEGFFAMIDGSPHCEEVPVRTCSNEPRFYYNRMGFALALVDYFLKQGDVDAAKGVLGYRFDPNEVDKWNLWELGQEPWLHREQNAEEIAALYQNGDPSDDPLNFLLRRKKWGMNTTTCQVCHQSQGKTWTQAEFDHFALPPEQAAMVGTWPEFATTWYASLRR
jgi:hypothetical protein